MKTAMQELWHMLDDAEQNGVFEIGTQNFKRYIEGIYLEKEKKQIIDAYRAGLGGDSFEITCQDEVYFQRTYINPNYGDCSFEP